jgi:hypothetical protein
MLTSIVLQGQNLPDIHSEARPQTAARSVTMRDGGHQPVPNELACEVCSPVSRGKLLSKARISPDVLL